MTLTVQDYPKGFPRLACFLDSDDAFMVYRRFGLVFSRLLLNKQDEIQKMEATLLAMDSSDKNLDNGKYLMSRIQDVKREEESIPQGWPETRPQLLEKLEKKALEYGEIVTHLFVHQSDQSAAAELMLKAQGLKGLESPSNRDYRSVLHFMENDGGQVFQQESEWVYEKEDLVTLRPSKEHAWLDGLLERVLRICRCKLLSVRRVHLECDVADCTL